MSSSKVVFQYEFKYICGLADERIESEPTLCVYFDTHFVRSESNGGIVLHALDEHNPEKVYSGTLTAAGAHTRIPATACIGFACYAKKRNDAQMSCYSDAGTTHLKLCDLPQGASIEKRLPLYMETTRLNGGTPIQKGELIVRTRPLQIGASLSITKLEQCILGAPLEEMSDEVTSFLERRIQFESNMQDTWPGIKNVRAPMDISAAGVELTHNFFVPVEGFAVSDPVETNVGYFQNALERSLARRSMTIHDFASLDLAHKAELMASIICFAPQSFDYLSDTVEQSSRISSKFYDPAGRIGFENYQNMGATLAGDCEDGGKLSQELFNGFNRLRINAKENPELAELQNIASNYTFYLTLATVHGAKAEDETEHIGAHMFGLLLPKQQVRDALQATPIGRSLEAKLKFVQTITAESLPTLFCEGTGNIRPLGPGPVRQARNLLGHAITAAALRGDHQPSSYDPLFAERRYVSMYFNSKTGLKTEIPHDYGAPSNFYLGNLLGVTDEYMSAGHNAGAFIFGTVNPADGSITRGATFVDILNQSDRFAIIPCETMPDRIMSITREAVALRAPSRPFIFDESAPMSGDAVHPEWERLKRSVAEWGRHGISPYGSVDFFVRPHQFNHHSVDCMIDDLAKMQHVYKVDYQLEHITNTVHTYRVMLYVDHDSINEKP